MHQHCHSTYLRLVGLVSNGRTMRASVFKLARLQAKETVYEKPDTYSKLGTYTEFRILDHGFRNQSGLPIRLGNCETRACN